MSNNTMWVDNKHKIQNALNRSNLIQFVTKCVQLKIWKVKADESYKSILNASYLEQ